MNQSFCTRVYLVANSIRLLEADLLSPLMYSKIGVLFNTLQVVRFGVVYWLVQQVSLTMVASSNDWWQGSKIKQCRLEGWVSYVSLWRSVDKNTILFDSSHQSSNQARSKVTRSIRH